MSVYIKDMEMPKGCASCKISRRNGKKMICPFIWKCEWDIHDPMSADHRLDGCPLVPVPDHGRLIDADALHEEMYALEYARENEWLDGIREARGVDVARVALLDAPTIIPASTEDKEGEG